MIDNSRRRLLRSTAALLPALIAGCYGASDYPRHRSLSLRRISVQEERSIDFDFTLQIVKSATGEDEEKWNTFHDVRVVGYSESGELVCEKVIGDVSRNGESGNVSVTCSGFPHLFTFDTAESPCEEDTEVAIATYQGRLDGDHYWSGNRERQCNEGLPPPVPTEN